MKIIKIQIKPHLGDILSQHFETSNNDHSFTEEYKFDDEIEYIEVHDIQ